MNATRTRKYDASSDNAAILLNGLIIAFGILLLAVAGIIWLTIKAAPHAKHVCRVSLRRCRILAPKAGRRLLTLVAFVLVALVVFALVVGILGVRGYRSLRSRCRELAADLKARRSAARFAREYAALVSGLALTIADAPEQTFALTECVDRPADMLAGWVEITPTVLACTLDGYEMPIAA